MSYWNTYLAKRVSRRRALTATAAIGGAAAFLAACGGDDDDDGAASDGAVDQSGFVTEPKDTTSSAVPGGIWVKTVPEDALGWDPHLGARVIAVTDSAYAYSRLLKYKTGTPEDPPTGDVEGDAAESFEVSPDGLTVTFKLRPGVLFDPRPPTSGREVTIEDIKFSWDRFSELSAANGDLLNSVNPDAPVASMSTPDDKTVVWNLAFPYAPILTNAAYHWYLTIMPVETGTGFDPKSETRGSGPWFMEEWKSSQSIDYKRNPNFHVKDRPFLEGIRNIVLAEYSAIQAQFEAGQIWTWDDIQPKDILPMKKRNPELVMKQDAVYDPGHPQSITFGAEPEPPFGLFRDQRMRQAVSMLFDRDQMIELFEAPSQFEQEGIDVRTDWHSHISAGTTGFWVDPKSDEMGEGSKYFFQDIDEAKKLVSAAGMTDQEFTLFQTNQTPERVRLGEVISQILSEGLNIKLQILDQSEMVEGYWRVKDFAGLTIQNAKAEPDIDGFFASKYSITGRNTFITQDMPEISDLIQRQRQEFDRQERIKLVKEVQRKMAVYMPSVPEAGAARGFRLHWPWLMNEGAILDSGINAAFFYDTAPHYWYDESKQT